MNLKERSIMRRENVNPILNLVEQMISELLRKGLQFVWNHTSFLSVEVGTTSIMRPRNFTCTSQMFDEDLNQNQSYLHPEPRRTGIPENVSFMFSVENETATGFNFISHSNSSPMLNNYPLSEPNQETPGYMATSTTSYGRYCPNPPNYAQYMPSSSDYGRIIPSIDNGRVPCKRKSPSVSMLYERGSSSSSSGYYSSDSSSDSYISSGFQSLEEPSSGSRYFTWDRTVVAPPNCSRGVPVGREGFQRNVRSQSSGTFHCPENNLVETYFSTNTRQHLQPREYPIDHLRNVDLLGSRQEQGVFPAFSSLHGGNLPSENDINHDQNQVTVERSMGGYQGPLPISARNSGVMWQNFHASAMQPTRGGRNNYAHRYTAASYRTSSLQHSGYAISSLEGGLQSGSETLVSSRYSRPVRNGHNRVGRSLGRISFARPQSLSDERERLFSEGLMVLDRPTFYGSGNFLDQHRDMRLDIDNMSYEELLALEERIGHVNTGLSEEIISKSLRTKKYCSSSYNKCKPKMQEEQTCVICQEEYMKEEEVGSLNCGHSYHTECIKKWLLLKNVCPICKAPALHCSPKD